jgi:hypothetical protein
MKITESQKQLRANMNKIILCATTIRNWIDNWDNVDFLTKILKDTINSQL